MTNVLEYLTAFGVAGGAGAKAFVPVFLLGLLHHTKYFELSAAFRWMAERMGHGRRAIVNAYLGRPYPGAKASSPAAHPNPDTRNPEPQGDE